ncbi:DNA-binding protein [Bacillus thuringiensis serovar yunnanensis]|nr:DNA-binding protein [Bacillus thuringiensis serovar yunnanensis]
MYPLGSKERPIIAKVPSKGRAERIATICDTYDFYYIVGLEFNEDISDLKKAIKDYKRLANIYKNCSCNRGKKYKFCCINKEIELDI